MEVLERVHAGIIAGVGGGGKDREGVAHPPGVGRVDGVEACSPFVESRRKKLFGAATRGTLTRGASFAAPGNHRAPLRGVDEEKKKRRRNRRGRRRGRKKKKKKKKRQRESQRKRKRKREREREGNEKRARGKNIMK
ncbi:MAG TPA: hypothetical protein VG797_07170 [Phycisphaerales bacterium]|nr:hypothetical protein [Phycisphaerales bacterium]